MLAAAPAASAGGSAVVKMKPLAKLRTKSTQRRRGRDIAAHHAERLAQRALDHVDAVHQPFALGNAAAARAVEADARGLRRYRSSRHALRTRRGSRRSGRCRRPSNRRFRTRPAWAATDRARRGGGRGLRANYASNFCDLGAAVADALDHRGVVERVGQDDAVGKLRAQRAERRPVRHIARGEQQRGFLVVQVGQLGLEQHMAGAWCPRCCACRPRPRRSGRACRASRRAPWGAGPCRDSRSSTRR